MLIAWPTHNRRNALLQSMESFHRLKDKVEFLVVNSGEQELASDLNSCSTLVRVLEKENRKNWEKSLLSGCRDLGVPEDTVKFLLGISIESPVPFVTTGANRNLILLQTVGKQFLSVDDDVLLEPRKKNISNYKGGFPDNKLNHMGTVYFPDQNSLEKFVSASTRTMEGHTFLEEHFSALAYSSGGNRCALTLSGYYGDSGFHGPKNIFYLDHESLGHFLNDSQVMDWALEKRWLWRSSSHKKMVETSPVMLMCAGFANDMELPPFFPIGRNQDGSFGFAIKGCLEKAFIGHIDSAIRHAPLEQRCSVLDFEPLQIRINDLLILVWVEWLKRNQTKSYQAAAEHIAIFARADGFASRLQSLVSSYMIARAHSLQEKINAFEGSRWSKLAELERIACLASSTDLARQIPIEAQYRGEGLEVALEQTRRWVNLYARGLQHWEIIRRLAQAL